MTYYELPVVSVLAAILVVLPLPLHWRSRNVAALAIISWLFIVNLVQAINSVVWLGNTRNTTPAWCDIVVRIIVGASFALPVAILCICKQLEEVSSLRRNSFYSEDRKRRMILEGGMCFGLPLVFITLHYIVEGHRFDIFESIGCRSAVYISLPSVLIIWIPQLLFFLTAIIYAVSALRHFIRRRFIFSVHLQNSNSGLTTNQYLRLFAMAITYVVCGITLVIFNLYHNVSDGLRPWTTWDDIHSNWNRVDQWPEASMPKELRDSTMLLWWAMPVSSFIFFLSFGFGADVKQEYLWIWSWLKRTILRQCPSDEGITEPRFLPQSAKLKPLTLLNFRNASKTQKFPQISSPVLISTSNRSLCPLFVPSQTDPEGRNSQSDTTGTKAMATPSEMSSTCSFPTFAYPYDASIQESQSLTGTTCIGGDPSRPSEIPFSSLQRHGYLLSPV